MTAVANPMNLTAIEDALYAWFSGAMGIAVIWADQGMPQPAHPYGTIAINTIAQNAPDEDRVDADLEAPVEGAEVELQTVGLRTVLVSCNVYALARGAPILLEKARAALGMPSYLSALRTAGIAISKVNAGRSLPQIDSDASISRMQMDVECCIAANAAERVGYITRANATSDLFDASFVVEPAP